MKKIILAVGILSFAINTQALTEFQTGDIVTAADINGNFSELQGQIDNNAAFKSNALANGIPVAVYSYGVGYTSVTFESGASTTVYADGYPNETNAYYVSEDCSGQPYITTYGFDEGEVGDEATNPQVEIKGYLNIKGVLHKGVSTDLVKLYAKSRGYSTTCYTGDTELVAAIPLESDDFTLPLIITETGEVLTITEVVGEAPAPVEPVEPPGEPDLGYEVYGNGELIGWTSTHPTSRQSSITVKLSGYTSQTIYLYVSGNYSGFDNGSLVDSDLYFVGTNCTGNAYARVATESSVFWDIVSSAPSVHRNAGSYYESDGQHYQMSSGYWSYRLKSTGSCYTYSSAQSTVYAYHLVTSSAAPGEIAPIIEPPITIEGWNPTMIQDLAEAQ